MLVECCWNAEYYKDRFDCASSANYLRWRVLHYLTKTSSKYKQGFLIKLQRVKSVTQDRVTKFHSRSHFIYIVVIRWSSIKKKKRKKEKERKLQKTQQTKYTLVKQNNNNSDFWKLSKIITSSSVGSNLS